MNKTKIKIANKVPFAKDVLFIEGPTRAGKFLLANILNGFGGIEPVQQHGLLDQVPFWANAGLIEHETAKELLQSEIDTYCYEMTIGRNFNLRKCDKSSIFNVPNYQKYLARTKETEMKKLMDKFGKEKPTSFFIMHELMPNIRIYFETFPGLKVISINRNPVDLAFSWHKRGTAKGYLTDPRIAKAMVKGKNGPVLWFMNQWKDVYHNLPEMDRVILSLKTLSDLYKKSYRNLPKKYQKRILFVSYKDVLNNPEKVIKTISIFIGKKPLPEMKKILKREKLPATDNPEFKNEQLKTIRELASNKYFDILVNLEKRYGSQI